MTPVEVDAGAMSIMASFSSWKGIKMHAEQYLLTKVLKNELGFHGFIVSDWMAVNQIDPDYRAQLAIDSIEPCNAAGLIAAIMPARHAARVHPVEALRSE